MLLSVTSYFFTGEYTQTQKGGNTDSKAYLTCFFVYLNVFASAGRCVVNECVCLCMCLSVRLSDKKMIKNREECKVHFYKNGDEATVCDRILFLSFVLIDENEIQYNF